MSASRRVSQEALLAVVTAGTAYLALSPGLHEALHVVYNYAFTGGHVAGCGMGPWTLDEGRVVTCFAPGGRPALNALLTPVTTALAGVGLMWASPRARRTGVRRGLLVAGAAAWAVQSLYGMGVLTPPALDNHGVTVWGDGIAALGAFGWPAVAPGACALALGALVLRRRVAVRARDAPLWAWK
ncbi:MAG: hypothetical protein ABEJ80_06820 [Halarchaeum sp.]